MIIPQHSYISFHSWGGERRSSGTDQQADCDVETEANERMDRNECSDNLFFVMEESNYCNFYSCNDNNV